MDFLTLILFIVGIGLLLVGAEALVRGAARLAATLGISPLVIGLTVVAFGTSSPELAVSTSSAISGDTDIAVGNVVGSNIFNVLFILGVAAIITPLVVARQLVRLDVPLMVIASFVLLAMAADGRIARYEGALLVAGIVAYTVFAIVKSRSATAAEKAANEFETEYSATDTSGRTILRDIGLIAGGLVFLVLGSEWLVNGAVDIAESLGVSELVIGLTIISVGTSLPEVATSILASIRGERDIAVGNVVGSNMFNILSVLGVTALLADGGIPVADAARTFDIPFAAVVALMCLPVFFAGYAITRLNGLVFLVFYCAYTVYLLLDASDHDALDTFTLVTFGFAGPIAVITFLLLAGKAFRGNRRRRWKRGEQAG
ncbi:MAG: calcium/sodium antiporter [Tepidiformaceae bacterium]